jgi:CRP-like cAMP-binding protein
MRALTAAEKGKLFNEHALFGILSVEDIDALLLHARSEHYPAGQLIFARGSPGRSMMAVLRGGVRISTTSPNGREVVLAILNSGEVFGEMASLDGGDRTADAIA